MQIQSIRRRRLQPQAQNNPNTQRQLQTQHSEHQGRHRHRRRQTPPPPPPPQAQEEAQAHRLRSKTAFDISMTRQKTISPTGMTRPVRNRSRTHDQFLPALTELPEGHASRNVVGIIFHTSWSPDAFSGRVEMIFKVQNGPKAVARFEEYKELVKFRARSGGPRKDEEENARCAADGNEVMGFHCLGPTSGGGAYDACGGSWTFPRGKGSAVICTYFESRERPGRLVLRLREKWEEETGTTY